MYPEVLSSEVGGQPWMEQPTVYWMEQPTVYFA